MTHPLTASTYRWLATGLCFLGTAAAGWAEEAPKSWLEQEFAKLDADKDGRLSQQEAVPYAALLGGADADKDGQLTLDEVKTAMTKKTAELLSRVLNPANLEVRFKLLDKSGDGKLTDGELKSVPWLRALDRDGDGGVALEEIRQGLADVGVKAEKVAPLDQPPPVLEEKGTLREAPRLMALREAGIGHRIDDVELQLVTGGTKRLSELTGEKATVIAVHSPTCPISKKYTPELARLCADAAAKGMAVIFLEAEDELKADEMTAAGLTGVAVRDGSKALRAALGVRSTTDTFVLDPSRTLVYRGAIDDRYGLGYARETARVRYLADALEAVLAGKKVDVAATFAPGCALDPVQPDAAAAAAASVPTFHGRVSRILQTNCQECHRAGGVAPFPLETFAQTSAKSGMIRRMVSEDRMPPWFAAPEPAGHAARWANDRSLSVEDKRDLLAWIEGGKPEGDAKDAPSPRTWPEGWAIGTPDAVWQIPQPIKVKAEGIMPYQNVVVDTGLTEAKWIRGWQVLPTAREVVHHVLVFVIDPAQPKRRQRGDGDGDGFFAAFVPGNSHEVYPPSLGKQLPAGAKLKFQIHYTPNGTAVEDQVKIGLVFSDKAPEHVVEVIGIAQPLLNIPPGAKGHAESASIPVPADVRVLGFMPHMHLRGQAFRYEVDLPDNGGTRTLLEVPRYDFNWQLGYRCAEPIFIPKGSRVRAVGWFDNSAGNPANPAPEKNVRWGQQTHEEMMLGYVEYYVPSQPVRATASAQ